MVRNVELGRPLDDSTFAEIVEAFHRYAVLVFPEQALDDEQQIAFSRRFGSLETSLRKDRARSVSLPEISDISNVDEHLKTLSARIPRPAARRSTSARTRRTSSAGRSRKAASCCSTCSRSRRSRNSSIATRGASAIS